MVIGEGDGRALLVGMKWVEGDIKDSNFSVIER